MSDGWERVETGEDVLAALGLQNLGTLPLDRLLLAPESARYLRVEADDAGSTPGEFEIRVPGTRFYFDVTACRQLRGDAMVALITYLATNSVPIAAIIAAARKVSDNLTRLSEEEAALVSAIVRACPGNPYDVPVGEGVIRDRYRGDPDTVDALLDALQSKGVITGHRGGRVKLVY